MTDFRDASVVVTGASSGIGRALAKAFHREGAHVYAAARNASELEALRVECGDDRLNPAVLDVTNEAAFADLLARVVRERGRLDVLVNNAGIVVGGDFETMDTATWRTILDVNLWGTIHGTQHAYRIMRAQGRGHILNTASSAGIVPVAKSAAYTATKHAVVGLSTALREEARKHGVRVSVALPGLVDTAIFGRAVNLDGYDYAAAMRSVPIRKITPERAAAATLAGLRGNRAFIVYPAYNRALIALYRVFPSFTGWLVNRELT